MKIINLTQHPASKEQKEAGVVDLPEGEAKSILIQELTFVKIPTRRELDRRAMRIALRAEGEGAAMIGGAPYLMRPLEEALRTLNIRPLYAFSNRESVEETLPDGSVKKIQIFKHLGFVEG